MRMLTAKLAAIGALLLLQACATYSPYYDSYNSVPTSSVYGYSSSEYHYSGGVPSYSYLGSYRAGSPYIYDDYYAYPRKVHSRHYRNSTRVIRNRSIHRHGKHYQAPRSRGNLKKSRRYRKHRRNDYHGKQIARRNHSRHTVSPEIKTKHRYADKHVKRGHVRPGKQAHNRRRFKHRRNQRQNIRNNPRHRQYNARNRTNQRNHKQLTETRRGQHVDHRQSNRSRAGSPGRRMNKGGQSARNHRRQMQQGNRRLRSSQTKRRNVRHKGGTKRRAKHNRRRNSARNSMAHR